MLSFNFLVSILYTQLFQQLFYLADHKYGGSLPVHCHFIMDEFANVSLPDDFDKILSVMPVSYTHLYAALRSTLGSTFKQDASGSDKRYSFRLLAREPTDTVHLFEAAIDLLSYATYLKCAASCWLSSFQR